jgi:hypothetical protein
LEEIKNLYDVKIETNQDEILKILQSKPLNNQEIPPGHSKSQDFRSNIGPQGILKNIEKEVI